MSLLVSQKPKKNEGRSRSTPQVSFLCVHCTGNNQIMHTITSSKAAPRLSPTLRKNFCNRVAAASSRTAVHIGTLKIHRRACFSDFCCATMLNSSAFVRQKKSMTAKFSKERPSECPFFAIPHPPKNKWHTGRG